MLAQRLQLVEPTEPVAGKRLRIAIATEDLKSLNAHFGSARRFAFYDVTPTESRFVEASQLRHSRASSAGRAGKTPKSIGSCAVVVHLSGWPPIAPDAELLPELAETRLQNDLVVAFGGQGAIAEMVP